MISVCIKTSEAADWMEIEPEALLLFSVASEKQCETKLKSGGGGIRYLLGCRLELKWRHKATDTTHQPIEDSCSNSFDVFQPVFDVSWGGRLVNAKRVGETNVVKAASSTPLAARGDELQFVEFSSLFFSWT